MIKKRYYADECARMGNALVRLGVSIPIDVLGEIASFKFCDAYPDSIISDRLMVYKKDVLCLFYNRLSNYYERRAKSC